MTDLLIMALWTAVMVAGIIIPIIAMIICFHWVFNFNLEGEPYAAVRLSHFCHSCWRPVAQLRANWVSKKIARTNDANPNKMRSLASTKKIKTPSKNI
jgi:hypothetical protein